MESSTKLSFFPILSKPPSLHSSPVSILSLYRSNSSRRNRRRPSMEISAFSYQKFVDFALDETKRHTHLVPSPLKRLNRVDLDFGYRLSPFQDMEDLAAVVAVTFRLRHSESARRKQLEYLERRRITQPVGERSAGFDGFVELLDFACERITLVAVECLNGDLRSYGLRPPWIRD